jgi:GT2 family glycosyltransferase
LSSGLQISVILSTYRRPEHLRRSLASLALQRGVQGQFEVVVTDDGSADATAELVAHFSRQVDFPVAFTTHRHDGFRLALCRNEGARAASAPYLLFSDGDCLFPADHLRRHLRARRPGVAWSGDCTRLAESATQRIDQAAIASGAYRRWVARKERWRILQRALKDEFYQAVSHPRRPKLIGCNIALWRCDFQRVNGFDERFVGWGCEDDDLAQRLRQAGVRIASILRHTRVYHMWHPSDPSQPMSWRDGANVEYLLRGDKPMRCAAGLAADQPAPHAPADHAPADGPAPPPRPSRVA